MVFLMIVVFMALLFIGIPIGMGIAIAGLVGPDL